jgi:hypothetical protein
MKNWKFARPIEKVDTVMVDKKVWEEVVRELSKVDTVPELEEYTAPIEIYDYLPQLARQVEAITNYLLKKAKQ